jgi:hypothetical protein
MPSIRYAFVRCSSTVSSITNRVCAIWRWSAGAPRARTLAAPRASGGVHSGQLEPRWALAAGAEVAPAAFGQRRGAALLRQLKRQPQGTPASAPALIDQFRSRVGPGVRMLQPGRRRLDRRHGLLSSPGPSSPPITRPAPRTSGRARAEPRRPAPPSGVARQPHRSLVVAERGKRSGRVGAPLGLGGRSRSVRRRATHRGPTGDRRPRPTGASGLAPATDHDLHRRHHRHVAHAHFTAGRPAPDRSLGQHPADIVLERDDAYELGRIATAAARTWCDTPRARA